MKIVIFGASGVTGLLLVDKAIKAGHNVVAYVRNPSKINLQHEQLEVVKGELSDLDKLQAVIKTSDAVISALGPTKDIKDTKLAEGIKNIIAAMEANNISRFVAMTTTSFKDNNDKANFGTSLGILLVKTFFKHSYENVVLIGEYVSKSNLDWTLVRIPMLSNKPEIGIIKAGYSGDGNVKVYSLTRADLANFMLQQVTDKTWIKKSPAISN